MIGNYENDIIVNDFNISEAAVRFNVESTKDEFLAKCPGIVSPLDETPGIDKSWFSSYSGVKADKIERASQFVNALYISTLLSENKIEQALYLMEKSDIRSKVMLLHIVTNHLNNLLFSDAAKEAIFSKIKQDINNEHVSCSHASHVTDSQIADQYFEKYLPKLALFQFNQKVEKTDNKLLLAVENLLDKKEEQVNLDKNSNKIELLISQQQEKMKQKQLEEQQNKFYNKI